MTDREGHSRVLTCLSENEFRLQESFSEEIMNWDSLCIFLVKDRLELNEGQWHLTVARREIKSLIERELITVMLTSDENATVSFFFSCCSPSLQQTYASQIRRQHAVAVRMFEEQNSVSWQIDLPSSRRNQWKIQNGPVSLLRCWTHAAVP